MQLRHYRPDIHIHKTLRMHGLSILTTPRMCQYPYAPYWRNNLFSGCHVVARGQVRSFTAGDFKPTGIHIVLPLFFLWKFNFPFRHCPCMIGVFYIKYITSPKPIVVAIVIHSIAEPCWSKDFCLFPSPLFLCLLRFLYAWTDKIRSL